MAFTSDVARLIISVVVCLGTGFIGSLFTRPAIQTWYATLQKPSFTPPSWLFGPVWTVLYILMGIAAFLVWRKGADSKPVQIALLVFIFQLLCNALWSILFFGLRSPIAGLIDIALLWVLIVATMLLFIRLSTAAGILLIPYLLWVSYASVLNYSLWKINR